MPILPAHIGPAVLIGALAGKKLNLAVLITASLLIDIEALFWGTQYGEHGYLHTVGGATLFGIFYGYIFFIGQQTLWKLQDYSQAANTLPRKIRDLKRKDWRFSNKCIIISSIIAVYAHISLDWLMYDNIRVLAISDINIYYMLTSAHKSLTIVLVHFICLASFIAGILLYRYRNLNGITRSYEVTTQHNLGQDGISFWTAIGMVSTPFAIAGIGSILFIISMSLLFPNQVLDGAVTYSISFISVLGIVLMIIGYAKAFTNVNWKMFE
jgi:hypothetical protein